MSEQNRIDQHTLDLLNGGIDVELNLIEQEELDVLLAGSEELRGIRDEMEAFSLLLEELPEIEPPEHL